ncbi:MAG: molybdenum ABC transporter ATP-binding protein [Pseudomonadales bacterium]|nr:molybdenum ABC transporter ATP-binding protein [Pseudomonadales bacterium]
MSLDFDIRGELGAFRLQARGQLDDTGVTVLFGPSGAGKSSLLRMLAGLLPSDGTLRLGEQVWQGEGARLSPWERPVGMMFQQPTLFRHLSVRGNLQYVVRRRGGEASLTAVIEQTRIASLLDRSVANLSGGEAQRVALARALLGSPRLLLLDEPLSALDLGHRESLLASIAEVGRRVPVLYVTHNLDELLTLADQVWLMESGRLTVLGEAHEALASLDSPFVLRSDAATLIEGTVSGFDAQDHLLTVTVGEHHFLLPARQAMPQGKPVRLRIAARDVSLCAQAPAASSILNIHPVAVSGVRSVGPGQSMVQLELGEQSLLARVSSRSVRQLALERGSRLFAQVKAVALV